MGSKETSAYCSPAFEWRYTTGRELLFCRRLCAKIYKKKSIIPPRKITCAIQQLMTKRNQLVRLSIVDIFLDLASRKFNSFFLK